MKLSEQERVQQLTGPRVLAIFLEWSTVGQLSAKGPGHFFDGSIFNADPHELQVTWRSVYNNVVWLYENYLWIEKYL